MTDHDFYCESVLSGRLPVHVIRETDRVLAFQHTNPAWETHIVVIPKEHVRQLVDVADPTLMGEMFALMTAIIRERGWHESGYKIITNGGVYQSTPHLHFHLVAGSPLDPQNPTQAGELLVEPYFPSDTAARFRQLDIVKEIIFGSWPSSRASIGLLAIRLVAGLGIALHGFPKIQNPFGWMGDALPGILQACAALAEFGGGIAWILGVLTPLASLGLCLNMAVACYMVKNLPFVGKAGEAASELAWLYLATAVLLLTAGAGRFSVDYLLFRGRRLA